MKLTSELRALALLAATSSLAPAAAGQVPEAAPPPKAQELRPLQPIGEGDISLRADLVVADLRRIEALVRAIDDIRRVEAGLDAREAGVISLRQELDAADAERVSFLWLEDRRLEWLAARAQLAGWASVVRAEYQALQQERDELREVREQWQLTAELTNFDDLRPELQPRVQATLARIIDVEARVQERRNEVGSIEDRLGSQLGLVTEALTDIEALMGLNRGNLLARDSAPLWRAAQDTPGGGVGGDVMAHRRDRWKALLAFFGGSPGASTASLLWLLLLLAAATRFRTRGAAAPGDEVDVPAAGLLDRPFSIALAFALGGAVVMLPSPVGSPATVFVAFAAIPTWRLGSVLLDEALARTMRVTVVLALLVRAAFLGAEESIAVRFLLLVVAAVGFGLALRSARRIGPTAPEPRRVAWRATVAMTAATLLGLAVAANVLGWFQLSMLLTAATIQSLFAAFAFATIAAAFAVVFPAAISGGLGDRLPSLRLNRQTVERVAIRAVALVMFVYWLRWSLLQFQLLDPARALIGQLARDEVTIGGLSFSFDGILGALLILLVTWVTAGLVRFVLREEVFPRLGIRSGDGASLATLANYTIYSIGLIMAASAVGLSGTQLALVVGGLGVGIGFGLQTIVNNFVSGLILIFERPVKIGDVVQTTEHWGRVERIGIRASIIRSFDGAEIIVPNGELLARELTNWTRSDEVRRIEVVVGVAYGTEPQAVLKILLRVAREHPVTLDEPEPSAQMLRFGDSSLDFRVRCWVPILSWVQIASDLHVAIDEELKKAGITIPFPQRDLHFKSDARPTAARPVED